MFGAVRVRHPVRRQEHRRLRQTEPDQVRHSGGGFSARRQRFLDYFRTVLWVSCEGMSLILLMNNNKIHVIYYKVCFSAPKTKLVS